MSPSNMTSVERTGERAARFSLAATSLGLDVRPIVPAVVALAPELERCFAVRVASGLASIALVTRGDPADGSGLGERLGDLFAAIGAGGDVSPPATSGLEEHGGPVAITIGLDDEGGSLAIERRSAPGGFSLATALGMLLGSGSAGLSTGAASSLLDLGAHWKTSADAVSDEMDPRGRRGRMAFVLRADRPLDDGARRVEGVMRALGVTEPQRRWFVKTYGALAAPGRAISARLVASPEGLSREVGVEYRAVPIEDVVKVWTTFDPLPALGTRLGALAGALNVERAAAFEIHFRSTEPPGLSVTFDIGAEPSGLANITP
ncbi:hypothetical protein [Polyangium mundeleinium]|uniref:Uncharacterized protein n=1 Tax=Polyangium mundeleinium TaxID=2995306 RepID=A0ABT5F2Y8_9BACT|nr:hypothetical protein [Polyangium mundeleinium]MDC0747847.1 hypothetical protein [Polyangium mundeleinium]